MTDLEELSSLEHQQGEKCVENVYVSSPPSFVTSPERKPILLTQGSFARANSSDISDSVSVFLSMNNTLDVPAQGTGKHLVHSLNSDVPSLSHAGMMGRSSLHNQGPMMSTHDSDTSIAAQGLSSSRAITSLEVSIFQNLHKLAELEFKTGITVSYTLLGP
jgi:hypothetical protein